MNCNFTPDTHNHEFDNHYILSFISDQVNRDLYNKLIKESCVFYKIKLKRIRT